MTLLRCAVLCAAAIATSSNARAEVTRYALVIGANQGDRDDVRLRYAESDARRVSDALRTVGETAAQNIVELPAPTPSAIKQALSSLDDRIRHSGGESILFVFYSGHADAENLHLAGAHLAMSELRELVAASRATARVLVVDACHSGVITRVKGGHAVPSFAVHIEPPVDASGVAILTSSAAGEDAQESDQLQASFFTQYFVSGLLGAADADRDGQVTLSEAFTYAAERTLAATVDSNAGPQHATYRTELSGRHELVLSEPGSLHANLGTLTFADPGSYLVARIGDAPEVVAEAVLDAGSGKLALRPGTYRVTRRDPDDLLVGEFTVATGTTTVVAPSAMRRVAYAEVVRKGGTQRHSALSAFALADVRSDILDLGIAWGPTLGARVDFKTLSLEARLGVEEAHHRSAPIDIASRDTRASIAAMLAFDLGRVTPSLGIEVGALWLAHSFHQASPQTGIPDRDSYGVVVAPTVQLVVLLGQRMYLRADAAIATFFLPSGATAATGIQSAAAASAGAGIGWYF
jgi:hypothetical protein